MVGMVWARIMRAELTNNCCLSGKVSNTKPYIIIATIMNVFIIKHKMVLFIKDSQCL